MAGSVPLNFEIGREATGDDTLASLLAGGDELTRLGLVQNPELPLEALRILCYDSSAAVRLSALASRRCPASARDAARDALPELVATAEAMLRAGGATDETVDQWRRALKSSGLDIAD